MPVLVGLHEAFEAHRPPPSHPESSERLVAVREALVESGVADDLVVFEPRAASAAEVGRLHAPEYLAALESFGDERVRLDPDTTLGPGSLAAALRGAGAGLEAIERLRAGEASAAFLATRPPGHHARRAQAMGFCLLNHVAIAAAALRDAGERVLVLDWDAHHGNGTQEAFYEDPEVLYVSIHQFPAYPGTGSITETGRGGGRGRTVNVPLPSGTGGDAYRRAFDELVVPIAEEFSPSWLLVSAGFDAHRDDPLTDLGLSAGDFADLTERAMRLAAPGRRLFFLEGGYDLAALRASVGTHLAALCGERRLRERPTSVGPLEDRTVTAALVGRVLDEHRAALG